MTVVVVEARRAWRGNAARLDGVHLTGLALGGVAWFLGGLCGTLFYFAILHIVGLYLLAACLWEPHAGFGVVGVERTLGLGPAN
jgi:hypothetical protein